MVIDDELRAHIHAILDMAFQSKIGMDGALPDAERAEIAEKMRNALDALAEATGWNPFLALKEIVVEEGAFDQLVEAGLTEDDIKDLMAQIRQKAEDGTLARESVPLTPEESAKVDEIIAKRKPRH